MAKKKNYELAYQDKLAGMTYDQLAKKYKVTKSCVQSWQVRHWSKLEQENNTQEESDNVQNVQLNKGNTQNDMQRSPIKLDEPSNGRVFNSITVKQRQDTNPALIYEEYSRDNLPKLEPREERFVEEFIIDLSKTDAAIRAGYSVQSAAQLGCRLYDKPGIFAHIQVALAERRRRTGINADTAIRELARIALANPAKVVAADGSLIEGASEDDLAAIQSIKVKTIPARGDGEPTVEKEIRFHDKTKALDLFMKAAGMLIDKKQIDVTTKTENMQDDELDSRIKAYLDKATINVTPEK
jgi:phage terminase small subunit